MALLTVQETAKMLKVTPMTIRRYIAAGRLSAVKVGKLVRIREESLEQLMQPIAANGAEQAKKRPTRLRKPTPTAEALLHLVAIGRSAEPTDVAKHKDDYLAQSYEARPE